MKNVIRSSKVALLGALLGGFGAVPAVHAQSDSYIEEITVTAERREESLQDVGLSVTAFDESGLAARGIGDVSRLEFAVPGVNFAYAGNDAKFNVRGANSTNTFRDNASIGGTYVDGVYKPRASQQTRAFFDVQRVEFLKGPQGTLYGRNTFAGALNLYTNRPDLAGTSGGIDLGISSFSTYKAEGFYNQPLSDNFGIRIAGMYENGDGYIENDSGPNMGAQDDIAFRLSALWQPSDATEVLLRVSGAEETGTIAGLFGYKNICRNVTSQGLTDAFGPVQDCLSPMPGSAGTIPLNQLGPWDISQDFVPDGDLSDFNATLEINWDFASVSLKSITSYTDFKNLIGFDFDYSSAPHTRGWFDEEAESWSQELQLNSRFDGPFQFTSGIYYGEDESYFSFTIFDHTVENTNRPTVTGPGGMDFTVLTGTPIVDTTTSMGGFFGDAGVTEAEALGVFAQGEFSVSDAFRIIAGVRYSDESKNTFGGGSNFTANGPVTVLLPAGSAPNPVPSHPDEVFAINLGASGALSGEDSWDSTDWRFGLEWDVSDTAMLYLTAGTGFLSGASNASAATFTDQQESELIEVGLKSTLADGRLLFNVAAHMTDYTNLLAQFQTINPVTMTVQTQTRNGGEIEATGLEIESVWVPVDNFQLGLNVSLLDSEFGEFGQVYTYQLFNGQPADSFVDANGLTTPWSPEYTVSLSATYDVDLGDNGILTPSIQHFASDGYNTSNLWAGDLNHQQDSFGKTDVRVTWMSADERYSVSAFVENIEDEEVLARGNNGGSDNVQTGYLYPRNWGVRFKVRWE